VATDGGIPCQALLHWERPGSNLVGIFVVVDIPEKIFSESINHSDIHPFALKNVLEIVFTLFFKSFHRKFRHDTFHKVQNFKFLVGVLEDYLDLMQVLLNVNKSFDEKWMRQR
jgi:hypothetical protein